MTRGWLTWVLTFIALQLPFAMSSPEAQDACYQIRFAPGTTSTQISGVAPPEDVVCYLLETGIGQRATITVEGGVNIIFSIIGLIDAQDDYTFTTRQEAYKIVVGQLMRSITAEPFTLRFTVKGTSQGSKQGTSQAAPSRDQVAQTQGLLTLLGYAPGPVDGQPGQKTVAAVRAFQQASGLAVTGRIDADLLKALARALASKGDTGSVSRPRPAERAEKDSSRTTNNIETAASPESHFFDVRCPDFSQRGAFDGPIAVARTDFRADHDNLLQYRESGAQILVDATTNIVTHMAGDGGSTFYINGPQAGTGISGGIGADLVVVCALGDASTHLYLGPNDIQKDVVVIDENVFLNPPPGNPVLSIAGFLAETDRVIARVPAGMPITYDLLNITVGSVRLRITNFSSRIGDNIGNEALLFVTGSQIRHPPKSKLRGTSITPGNVRRILSPSAGAITLTGVPVTDAGSRPECEDPSLITNRAAPESLSQDKTVFGSFDHFGEADDTIVFDNQKKGEVEAGSGDDTLYAFNARSGAVLIGSSGSDQIVVCSLDANSIDLQAHLGDTDLAADTDADVLYLDQKVFEGGPDGFLRRINAGSFRSAPKNDRLILELPPGTEVAFEDTLNGKVLLYIGATLISLSYDTFHSKQPFDLNSIILVTPSTVASTNAIEPSGETETASSKPADMAKIAASCPIPQGDTSKPEVVDRYSWDVEFYSHRDDLVLYRSTRKPIRAMIGSGDDTVVLHDIGDDFYALVGSGADKVDLCSMQGFHLVISAGRDRHPDIVTIHAPVFQNVPDGIKREIWIDGFHTANDRAILHVPDGLEITNNGKGVLQVGQVRFVIGDAVPTSDPEFDPNAIVIQKGAPG